MWARCISAAIGLWLMVAPAVLDYAGRARTNDRITGPLVAAFAVVAIAEVTRGLRWAELVLGLWLVLAPWLLRLGVERGLMDTAAGVLLIALAFLGGRVRARFGGGWTAVLRPAEKRADTGHG